jgi:cytochrome c5
LTAKSTSYSRGVFVSEHDSNFFRTFTLVLVLLLVFMFVIIYLANTLSTREASSQDDPRVQAEINALIKPVGQVETKASAAAAVASAPAAGGAVDGKATFQSTCFACHGTGAAGAPKVGDKGAWGPRIAQGKSTLYQHALHGFTGKSGTMPAKGGNTALSDKAVEAAVDYMVSQAK